jgi:hypothetical protein
MLGRRAAIFAVLLGLCGPALAQNVSLAMLQPELVEPAPAVRPAPSFASALPEAPSQHKFWDNQNRALLATSAAFSVTDFAVTRSNLENGGHELNPVTRLFSGSTAGLALNFAGETAGVVGLSYFFHKTGHHKLERLTPLANIGISAVAVTYGLTHR